MKKTIAICAACLLLSSCTQIDTKASALCIATVAYYSLLVFCLPDWINSPKFQRGLDKFNTWVNKKQAHGG